MRLIVIDTANAVPSFTMAKLTPRDKDYSKWYNEIVVEADLAQQRHEARIWTQKVVRRRRPPVVFTLIETFLPKIE